MPLSFDWTWIQSAPSSLLMVVVSTLGIYVALILFTRMAGLRSFSKMSSFDFAMTVAFGSILASTVLTKDPPLVQAITGLGAIYLLQHVVSTLRVRLDVAARAVDNPPLLVMDGPDILHDNLAAAQMTENDLRAKLREANVTAWEQIHAVVVESTGDVSVLHGSDDSTRLDPSLLTGVRRQR